MYGGATGSLATEPRTPGRRGVGVFTRPSLTSARSPPVAPSTRHALRDRADRSWSSAGSGVPVVGEPGLGEESSGDDDGVGQRDEGLDHASAALGAEGEFAKAAVVPGVGPLDHPAAARLEWKALGADHTVAAELIEQVAGLARVVTSVAMDGDVVGQGRCPCPDRSVPACPAWVATAGSRCGARPPRRSRSGSRPPRPAGSVWCP